MRTILRNKPVFSALALAIGLLAQQAHAAPVSVSGTSSAEAPRGTAGTTSTAGNGIVYRSSYSSANDALGFASGSGFANTYGAFGVGANATGNALAAGGSGLTYSVTNTTSIAQAVSMSFFIYGGSMSSVLDSGFTGALATGEFIESSYLARILVGGSQVWSSGATLRREGATVEFTGTGTTLNGADTNTADGDYSWSSAYYTIDLGVLAAGETFNVVTELTADAESNVGTYTYDAGNGGCYGGYGYGGYGYGDGYGCGCETLPDVQQEVTTSATPTVRNGCEVTAFKGGASIFYGDPVDFAMTGADGSVVTSFQLRDPAAVPLPSTVWLAGLAVAGLLAQSARRRRA